MKKKPDAKLLFFIFIASLIIINSFNPVFAQIPVINSFSPSGGTIGSTVTINGNNFSGNTTENIVFLGATRAVVSSAAVTQLNIVVPLGASYQPITVKTDRAIVYSEAPFVVAFKSAGSLNAQTFANKIDFASGANVYGTASRDLDGDGKPDLVVVNAGANSISILRNSGVNAPSFIQPTIYSTGTYPIGIAIEDLDEDGRPDLAVTNFNSNTISIFHNTSRPGNISFTKMSDLQTGTGPYGIAVADFDGDGRPDIVVSNQNSGTISIFRNGGSIPGDFIFNPKNDLTAGSQPRSIATADIDGDGKPDILVTNQGSASISIFQNTSALYNASFGSRLDFPVPANSSPEGIATGDLNNDGRLDIAVANNNSPGNLSVFQNVSSPGSINLTDRIEYGTGNNPFSIAIGDIDGDEKPDIAVTNQVDNTVSVLINKSLNGSIALNNKIDYATGGDPRSVTITDKNGDGLPDLIVGNNNADDVSVLVDASALPPTVTSFTPATAGSSATVTITGTNFTGATAVTFGGIPASSFTFISDGLITAVVGTGASGNVSVTTPAGTGSAAGFTYIAAPSVSYQTPQVYQVNTPIAPLAPQNTGGAVATYAYGQVSTLTGNGTQGATNGTATNTSFYGPYGVAVDVVGNIYVADRNNNLIRRVTPSGFTSLLAGSGSVGNTDGTGAAASFNSPTGITVDQNGNIYVADAGNNLIRKVTQGGIVTTIAGGGAGTNINGTGPSASFNYPTGIAVDGAGNLYVADQKNCEIRKITPSGVVSTLAGSGVPGSADGISTEASFSYPTGLTIDVNGNIYVADFGNNLIRKITPAGVVTTIGISTAPASANVFNGPYAITIDVGGNLYVTDFDNELIRMVSPAGQVVTLAGVAGVAGNTNGIGTLAKFNSPAGIAINNSGAIYIGDSGNNDIRQISVIGYTINKPLPAGLNFDPTTGIISGTPTTASPATNYTVTAYNAGGSSSTVVNIGVLNRTTVAMQPPVISYQTPQAYVINKIIAPLMPTNTGGAVPATIYGQVSTYAGSGASGAQNGSSLSASFNVVTGVGVDPSGDVFVGDWMNNLIREVSPAGVVTTFAGSGSPGAVNGQGTAASFNEPDGLTVDALGNVYVGDQENNLVRMITPGGLVSTLAGSGNSGLSDGTGTAATFNSPRGVGVDGNLNVYVADQQNNAIRVITPLGVVTTLAGNGNSGFSNGTGAAATFNTPTGVGIDASGNVYVADAGNNAIRKITGSVVTTIAGNGITGSTNGTGNTATFNFPREVRADGTGNLYVSDQRNNLIRMITPAGIVTTVAGTGQQGAANGNGNVATFAEPLGLVLDGKGNLFVGDNGNNLVRKIVITGYTIDKPLPAGLTFDPTTGAISGTPNVISPATNYTITAFNGGGSSSTVVNIQISDNALLPSVITFPAINNPPLDANNDFSPNATSTNPDTPIEYTSSNPAVATITSTGLIHLVGPGVTTITATQAGDSVYSAAIPVSNILTVIEYQNITFPAISAKTVCSADFSAGAGSDNNTIPLTYSSSDTTVAKIDTAGNIHIVGPGTTTITVSQAGATYIIAATPVSEVLTVSPALSPVVSIQSSASGPVCSGTSITFTATPTNGGPNPEYQWQVNGINAGTDNATFTSGSFANGDTVTCVLTNNSGACLTTTTAASNKVGVGIIPLPTVNPSVTIAPVAIDTCAGSPIIYTATASNAGTNPTYQWAVNGQNAGTNDSTFTSSTLQTGDQITCTVTTSVACSTASATSAAALITVHPVVSNSVSIKSSASDNIVAPNQQVTFTATAADTAGVTYQWTVDGIDQGSNSPYFVTNTLANHDVVTCSVTTPGRCVATPFVVSNSISIILITPIVIPNTFTPNGDGINDTWDIPALAAYPGCTVSIFNRYGTLLLQSTNYPKPWDGTYNGVPLPTATYYYIIDPKNGRQKLSGFVTILR